MKRLAAFFLIASVASWMFADGIHMRHTVTLKPGWNAFYLPVTPPDAADVIFADWPVQTVGYYDQGAFLRTVQFTVSASDSSLGAVDPGMKMWVRGNPGHSSFDTLAANGVYVTVNTNRQTFVAEVYGVPAAYRVSWHVADGVTSPVNYVGIACDGTAEVAASGYLQGLETAWQSRWAVYGAASSAAPGLKDMARNPVFANGEVVAMDAKKVSDWSGVLNVSPASGFSLGTNLNSAVLSVRNDSGTNRIVRVGFRGGEWADGGQHATMPTLMYLDRAVHDRWQASLRAVPYVRELGPGETLRLELAVDRARELLSPEVGVEYGGLVDVADVSATNPSGFRTTVPFSALSDGGAFRRERWPKGLWTASVTLDKVGRMIAEESAEDYRELVTEEPYDRVEIVDNGDGTATTNLVRDVITLTNRVPVLATAPVPTPRPMTVRLLVHVDANGAMKLLQRARYASRRLSAAVLPTDTPVLSGSGAFGRSAAFAWTVAAQSKANPFRHARHPDHDGRNADFSGPAPDGDDFDNYLQTVKPELFSVASELSLVWRESTAAAWSPEEQLSGTCAWSLTGLRREGAIRMEGAFTMRRLSSAELADLIDVQ